MMYFILAFLIVLADQSSKYLITLQFSQGGQLDLIPNILRITYTTNSGGAFSMFSDHTLVLSIVSAVVCIALIVLMITLKKASFIRMSLSFILGGAIGNLIDRFVMGYVVDMFEPLFINFAVFNVADIFITIGAILFVIGVIFFWPKKAGKEEIDDEEETEKVSGPAPMTYAKPKNAKDRRQQRHAKKFGPDIDETTIIIPVDDVKSAIETAAVETPVNMDDTMVVSKPAAKAEPAKAESVKAEQEKETDSVSLETEKLGFEMPDFSVSTGSGDHEFTLEEIMKEYGHDF